MSDFRWRNIIVVFYAADRSPVCGDQLALYNELLEQFEGFSASLVAISVDGGWCHLAYRKDRDFHFPLPSYFEPKGEVAQQYGVYRQQDGTTERALFVIEKGSTRWCQFDAASVARESWHEHQEMAYFACEMAVYAEHNSCW